MYNLMNALWLWHWSWHFSLDKKIGIPENHSVQRASLPKYFSQMLVVQVHKFYMVYVEVAAINKILDQV